MRMLLLQGMLYLPTWGGANKATRLLVEGLAQRGNCCRVLAPATGRHGPSSKGEFLEALAQRGMNLVSSSARAEVFEAGGVEVHALSLPGEVRRYAAEQISTFRPELVVVTAEDPGHVLLETAMETSRAPVIYLAQTPWSLPFGKWSLSPNQRTADRLKHAAGCITISQYMRAYLRQWGGVEAAVIPMPVYGAGPFPNLGSFEKGFVTMINPSAVKGLTVFLSLARHLRSVDFAAVPTWASTGADRELLKAVPNVQVLPPADDIDEILSRSRVVLVPSLWQEAFGYIVVEAMLRGIPVLASDVGGLPEAKLGIDYVLPVAPVESYNGFFSETGYPVPVVPAQDIGPWQEALGRLLSDPRHYQELSQSSRAAALKFVSGIGIDSFGNYFAEVIEKHRPAEICTPEPSPEEPECSGAQLDQLSAEQRSNLALRALKLKREKPGRGSGGAIPRAVRNGNKAVFSLSSAQERIWLACQLHPESSVYNVSELVRVLGPLDLESFERSVGEIVRRHEILRTRFVREGDAMVQVVDPEIKLDLQMADLSEHAEGAREKAALQSAADDAERPFSLEDGPLFRIRIWRLKPEAHLILLTLHHIICDGWSINLFLRDLGGFYSAFCNGRRFALPDLPVQYGDFADWERQRLQDKPFQNQADYWKQRLAGYSGVVNLSTDRSRPATPSFRGAMETRNFSRELTQELKAFSQKEEVTLFMTLLAGFFSLLQRYTAQEDIALGTALADRDQPETSDLIGCFLNTVVLRADLSGDPTFLVVLERVRECCLGAYAHRSIPLEQILEELRPGRGRDRQPFFQVMFVMQNMPLEDPALDGLRLERIPVKPGTAAFDLSFGIEEGGEGLQANVRYNTDLFGSRRIERMLGHWQRLLASAVADPAKKLSELPLLSAEEERELLRVWNHTARVYPERSGVLPKLIETQAARTPGAVAAAFRDQKMTFDQLNTKANQLARALQRRGVGPEVLVGVCLERSLEMVIALLGILKAGGAYVPLDPELPAERIRYMASDAGVQVLLSQERLAPLFQESGVGVILLDSEWHLIEQEHRSAPECVLAGDNAAYMIYTSGSTGRPKGVVNTHRGVVNRLLWMQAEYQLTAQDCVLQKTPYSFDVSVWEFFWPLITGARMVLAEPGGHRDPAYLIGLIRSKGITTIHFVPSMLQAFLEESEAGRCETLRQVICSGEALSVELEGRFFAKLGARLHNLYGPTEAAIDVTSWECERHGRRETVPIGRPIANTQIHLLAPGFQLVPAGIPGELHIGGEGLARGYHGRADLTAERFIPNAYSAQPGTRLYRTGDLARQDWDGRIEYLGRLDDQVKLRGTRIELGEVESALNQHPAVGESVVTVAPGAKGDPKLVAYLVPSRECAFPVWKRIRMEKEGVLAGHSQLELPNGFRIACLPNQKEAESIYREVFEEKIYLRHGIRLEEGDCIFDVGANIGLFTLFAWQEAAGATIFAFEPIPSIFEVLKLNTELYGVNARLFECGLADRSKTGVRAVSEIIQEHGIEEIDLLKIDVEKSELDVLAGMGDTDWNKIKQIVVEVHSQSAGDQVAKLLAERRFGVEIDRDKRLEGFEHIRLYARREGTSCADTATRGSNRQGSWHNAGALLGDLRRFLEAKLPSCMVPSAFMLLDAMPLTPNGKINRKALPAMDSVAGDRATPLVEPRTSLEREVARIWRDILGVQQIGVEDSFFEMGGHSLLLTQVASRMRAAFHVDIPLRVLFDGPTILEMTVAILAQQLQEAGSAGVSTLLKEVQLSGPA